MSPLLLLNIFLAFAWCAAFGSFTLSNLLIGFIVGSAALWFTRPLYGETDYFQRGTRTVQLGVFFIYELIVSSLRVVWDVLTPAVRSRPGIVAVPMDAKTDMEIMLLANLISLTPGTLSLDVSPDRRVLYVHAMFIDDPRSTTDEIKQGMERRLMEVMR